MSVYTDSKYLNLISSRLRNFAKKKDELWNFSCPLCGDSTKDKKKARGYVFRMKNDLVFKCHNCGQSMLFSTFLKRIDETLHDQYMTERFVGGDVGRNVKRETRVHTSPALVLTRERSRRSTPDVAGATRLSALPDSHPCKQYAINRKLPESALERLFYVDAFASFVSSVTNMYLDRNLPNDGRLLIPFFDKEGKMTMFQGRSIDPNCDDRYRYITVRLDTESLKAFGLERVNVADTLYVVEGPIDSLFFDNAIATADASLYKFAEIAPDVVLVFDNEPRNRDLHKIMRKAIEMGCKVVIWEKNNRLKDVNDMVKDGRPIESIMNEIKRNTYSGLELQLKFSEWSMTNE